MADEDWAEQYRVLEDRLVSGRERRMLTDEDETAILADMDATWQKLSIPEREHANARARALNKCIETRKMINEKRAAVIILRPEE